MIFKSRIINIIFYILLLVCCLLIVNENNDMNATSDNIIEEVFSIVVIDDGYIINSYLANDVYYLFLPQGIDLKNVVMKYTGNVTDISSGIMSSAEKIIVNDFSVNNTIIIESNNNKYAVTVLKSDLPSMSIFLNNVSLEDVNSGNKDIKYKDNLLVLETEDYSFIDTDIEIKGRGNFTWTLPKKAYQLKLSLDKNLFGLGRSKTWILLANYADASLMRNKITFDLANDIGLEYTSNSEYIDLWVNGDYLGNYLIVEKIEVGKNHVQLTEDDALLVEIDNNYYEFEDNYFISKFSNTAFVLKDSVSSDEDKEFSKTKNSFSELESYINELESYLYSDNKDFKKISSMIDVESFIKYYFIQEFTENPDGARSSVYLYKNGSNDKLHIGPVWDYDSSLGNYTSTNLGGNTDIDYMINIKGYMENSNDWYNQLFKIQEFKNLAIKFYNETMSDSLQKVLYNINDYRLKMKQSSKMNFIRWDILGKSTPFNRTDRINGITYDEEVEYLLNWIIDRKAYLDERYKK